MLNASGALTGARSTRSQLPGEIDNEDDGDMLDVPDEMPTKSRPGSAPHVLVPVDESLSIDGMSPQKDDSLSPLRPSGSD
jgi:hypothetical protein